MQDLHTLDKPALERRKLAAEVAKLEQEPSRLAVMGGAAVKIVGFVGAVLAAASTGWAVYSSLDQRAQERRFRVDQQIITLAGQLAANDPVTRANAALLLVAFEDDAIPILVKNLRFADRFKSQHDLSNALALVLETPNIAAAPARLFDPLLAETREIFIENSEAERPRVETMLAFLHTISQLIPKLAGESVEGASVFESVDATLAELQRTTQQAQWSGMWEETRDDIVEQLTEVREEAMPKSGQGP